MTTAAISSTDVLIIGAGLSGIDAAYRIQTRCPQKSFAIIEARERIGGTWDLFNYPGVRSDSDVETLGFPFKPWMREKSIADGASIRSYVEETAREFGLDRKIEFGLRAIEAHWLSSDSRWEVKLQDATGATHVRRCSFLYGCTGYYNYAEGYRPEFPGLTNFKGQLIHPQFWPASFNAKDKSIVVIGSGATAITLLPELAKSATKVTMLQRSPTYIVSKPAINPVTRLIKRFFPSAVAHRLVRLNNIIYGISVYRLAQKRPEVVKHAIMKLARKELPADFDYKRHLRPRYNPWDQRLCLTPDGDFFAALKSGRASIATDEIETFEATGVRLKSGEFLPADAVVTATGLKLQLIGGMKMYVDEKPIDLSKHYSYKGVLLSEIPNFAMAMGYTNASWTLKCDLAAEYVCRLLNYMSAKGYTSVVPRTPANIQAERLIGLTSGYVTRGEALLPKQGQRKPWKLHQNFFRDWLELGWARVRDAQLKFG